MKNTKFIFIILLIIALVGLAIFFFSNSNSNMQSEDKKQEEVLNSLQNTSIPSSNEILDKQTEVELTSFSTPLAGDENRLENIRISCERINGTTLKNGDSFSFNDIIGEPTEDKGYKEADVIIGTKLTKGFGGGNCQVSTTLYNACLNVEGIEVNERHPHKRKVAYVEEGKDASVSYGTLDLKFTNNTGKTIKIYMNSEEQKVTASIVES